MSSRVTIVGGGFAGVEAAWVAANRGISVKLYEMRPKKMTPAHKTSLFAELVCSNSFKSKLPTTPAGQLKSEMVALGSLIIPTGEKHTVPGGEALTVDREKFSEEITQKINQHPNIEVIREEFTPELIVEEIKNGPIILCCGPLITESLSVWLAKQTGQENLYFYDAVSPTIETSSINFDVVFAQSRYDKGGNDYLNCPFNKEEYEAFVNALVAAEQSPIHEFEEAKYFSGCMPIEEIARKGIQSLAFGNFKPVGLTDPKTGKRPYAVLQLRPENKEKTLYTLVACQNRIKWGQQKEIFKMVPGLENAEFVRLGVIHRNSYIHSPKALTPYLELKNFPRVYVAGQLTGVEGYVESAAMGLLAGLYVSQKILGSFISLPPRECAYGSLCAHLQDTIPREFAPMNINWGLFPDPETKIKNKQERQLYKLQKAKQAFDEWKEGL